MFKMRMNLRKLTVISAVLVFVWIVVSFSSLVEVPGNVFNKNNAVNIENRMDNLQKLMDYELSESNKLLAKIKHHMNKKKTKPMIVKEEPKEFEIVVNNEQKDNPGPILPVLVIACDRLTVKRCLDNLVKFRPNKETFPIIVSQDCGHNATYQVIKSFTAIDPTITVIRQPDQSVIPLPRSKLKFRGYYNIARHYKFALNHVLQTLNHEAVIIVEDDLDISPDFFEYFLGTYPLLHKDSSLWCISAWNDNGKKSLIELSRSDLLHRTDFFPGLGWLMRRETWPRLKEHWPEAFFDDWLRNPENTQGRACIRPEVSRTYSFGKVGVSKGLYFDMHLRYMQLNMDYVQFTKLNLTYLLKENYDEALTSTVYSLPEMTAEEVVTRAAGGDPAAVRVSYSNAKTYRKAAKKLGLMDDFRSGVPRTAYLGIVTCFIRGRRVYLAPDFQFTKYDRAWE